MLTHHHDQTPEAFEAWWQQHYGEKDSHARRRADEDDYWLDVVTVGDILKAQYRRFWQLGADLDFLVRVIDILVWYNPHQQVVRALVQKIPREEVNSRSQASDKVRHAMKDLIKLYRHHHGIFSASGKQLLEEAMVKLQVLYEWISAPYDETRRGIGGNNPLFAFLEDAYWPVRQKGRPGQDVPTFFMVLLVDHLRQRVRQSYYADVGDVAKQLFPGCLTEESSYSIADLVKDRCKKFKRTHDVSALKAALHSAVLSKRRDPSIFT
jgi:hypothetical protein